VKVDKVDSAILALVDELGEPASFGLCDGGGAEGLDVLLPASYGI
jgi:hypothetical protein